MTSQNRVIYEPKGRAQEYARLAARVFETCEHACLYCYLPYIMHKDPKDFFAPTRARKNLIPKLLLEAKVLKKNREKREILLTFTSDAYQSDSKICKETTRAVLDILFSSNLNVTVLTKGGERSLRDIDLFKFYKDQFTYGATLVFSNDSDSLFYEPNAAPTSERIDVLKTIHDEGIRTWVSIEPAWSIEDSIDIIERTHTFVDRFKIGKLNYHPHSDEVDWSEYTNVIVNKLIELNKSFYVK